MEEIDVKDFVSNGENLGVVTEREDMLHAEEGYPISILTVRWMTDHMHARLGGSRRFLISPEIKPLVEKLSTPSDKDYEELVKYLDSL